MNNLLKTFGLVLVGLGTLLWLKREKPEEEIPEVPPEMPPEVPPVLPPILPGEVSIDSLAVRFYSGVIRLKIGVTNDTGQVLRTDKRYRTEIFAHAFGTPVREGWEFGSEAIVGDIEEGSHEYELPLSMIVAPEQVSRGVCNIVLSTFDKELDFHVIYEKKSFTGAFYPEWRQWVSTPWVEPPPPIEVPEVGL